MVGRLFGGVFTAGPVVRGLLVAGWFGRAATGLFLDDATCAETCHNKADEIYHIKPDELFAYFLRFSRFRKGSRSGPRYRGLSRVQGSIGLHH